MKKTISHLTLSFFVALMFLSSCKKNSLPIDNNIKNDALSIKEKVAKLGFDTTNILINAETIIVEGDIILTKTNLNKTIPRQASSIDISNGAYPIDYSRQRYLKYYIDVSTLSAWESAIVSAFSKYTLFPDFNLRFTRTTNINEADVRVELNSNNTTGSWFPSNGQIGIRLGVTTSNSYTEAQKIYFIVHEIGHTIGLRHTNWRGVNEAGNNGISNGVFVGAYTIPGTNNSSGDPDPASVFNFNETTTLESWTNFSQFDQIALVNLYPSFTSAQLITSPNGSSPVSIGQNISASISIPNWREGGLTYEWSVQGATIVSNNGTFIHATVTNTSSAAVSCRVTNAHGESISASKSFGPIEID